MVEKPKGGLMSTRTITSLFAFVVLALTLAIPGARSQTIRTFTRLDVPQAIHTEANGIDGADDVVGFFIDSKHVEHGFKDVAGSITTIDVPGATGTRASGIDLNDNFVVGSFTDSTFTPHGFLLASGQFTTIDVPNAAWTRAFSVNSLGTIAGAFVDKAGVVHGFLHRNGSTTFTTLDVTGAVLTQIHSIVNLRYMAGIFVDSSAVEHGVQGASGQLVRAVNFPGAGLTSADGVNDAINIVGHFGASAAGPFHGYLFMGGQFQEIDFPNATDTRCNAVSDALVIVGRFTDAKGAVHGFIAK
jgi:uncharacterized membrane protein